MEETREYAVVSERPISEDFRDRYYSAYNRYVLAAFVSIIYNVSNVGGTLKIFGAEFGVAEAPAELALFLLLIVAGVNFLLRALDEGNLFSKVNENFIYAKSTLLQDLSNFREKLNKLKGELAQNSDPIQMNLSQASENIQKFEQSIVEIIGVMDDSLRREAVTTLSNLNYRAKFQKQLDFYKAEFEKLDGKFRSLDEVCDGLMPSVHNALDKLNDVDREITSVKNFIQRKKLSRYSFARVIIYDAFFPLVLLVIATFTYFCPDSVPSFFDEISQRRIGTVSADKGV